MTTKPEDLMMGAWKQQFGTALRLVEAIAEESRKMRESQLASAVQAHADAVATREQLEKAADAQEVWRIQREWWSANLNRSAAYWREAYEGMVRAQAVLAQCLGAPAEAAGSAASTTPNAALFGMVSDAYKRWMDTTSAIYAARAGTGTNDVREAA